MGSASSSSAARDERVMYVRGVPLAKLNGAEIYFESHGEGEPLLLIPGFDFGVWSFYRQLLPLAEHMRVISLEPRGVGRSSPLAKGISIADMADDAAALLDHLELERSSVLGFSMGGFVAFELALRHPTKVSRLIAAATQHGGPKAVHPKPEIFMKLAGAAAETDMSLYFSDVAIREEPELCAEFKRIRAANPPQPGNWMQRASMMMSFDVRERLPELDMPVLISVAQADDIVPAGNAQLLAERLRHARIDRYPGGRHLFYIEHGERFNQSIVGFVTG